MYKSLSPKSKPAQSAAASTSARIRSNVPDNRPESGFQKNMIRLTQSSSRVHQLQKLTKPVVQRTWEYVDDTVMQWTKPSGGLEWYYSTESRMMSFKIIDNTPDYIPKLAKYEGKPRPYQEWRELWAQNNWMQLFPTLQDTSQHFGTDIPMDGLALLGNLKDKSPEEKIRILSDAMKAGYRKFDLAEAYGTSHLLKEAAKVAKVPENELEITYKIGPKKKKKEGEEDTPDNRPLKDRLIEFKQRIRAQMTDIPASSEKVLMLHDMPDKQSEAGDYINALYEMAVSGEAGYVKSLGVSNVTIETLDAICKHTESTQIMKIKYVENRFSPYEQDAAVRMYCAQHNITYLGFGLFGGSSNGFCSEGFAMPQRHLQALQDPRLLKLSDGTKIKPHTLLLAWARHKGVGTVVYSGSNASDNFKSQELELHPKVIEQIDSFFTFKEGVTDSKFKNADGIKYLYSQIKDPTSWFIFDVLMENGKVRALLQELFAGFSDKYGPGAGDKIINTGQRLIRLVTHLQSMKKMGGLEKEWPVVMAEAFEKVASNKDESVMGKLEDWTQKNYMEVGGATHAEENIEKIYKEELVTLGADIVINTKNCLAIVDPAMFSMPEFKDMKSGDELYCMYAPKGFSKEKFKITVKIKSVAEPNITVTITKLTAPI